MEASRLIDRQILKRRLLFWRVVAVVVLLVLIGVLAYRTDFRSRDRIARIAITGIITEDNDRDRALAEIADDPHIKALIVRINSPGGSTTGSEELYLGLRRVAAKKPVVSVIGTVGASGGYITAIAGDRIFVRKTSLTGSIGVLMETAEFSGLMQKLGIKAEQVTSGPLKGQPSPARPMSDKVRRALQDLIDDAYHWFVGLVHKRRGIDDATLAKLADGRVYTGRQAVADKLVDAIGGEREAVKWLETERKVQTDLPIVDVRWGEDDNFFGRLFGSALAGWLPQRSLGLDGLIAVWHPSLSIASGNPSASE